MRKAISFRRYLLLGNLVLILLPLFVVGAWIAFDYQAAIDRSIRRSNERVAEAIAGRLDEFFARQRDAINRITEILTSPGLYAPERRNEFLAAVLRAQPFLENIEVIDQTGVIRWLAPYDTAVDGISRRGDAVYEAIRTTPGIYFSVSYISLQGNQPALTFGQMMGPYTVECSLDLRAINQFASRLSREFGSEFELRITDRTGVFIYHPDTRKVQEREVQSSFQSIRRDGTAPFSMVFTEAGADYLVSGVALERPHWFVLVFAPHSLAYAPLRSLTLVLVLVLLAIAVGGVAYSQLHIRRVIRGLDPLLEGTVRLADGDFCEISGYGGGFREFERVGDSFNTMVGSLRQRETELRDQEAMLEASLREKEVLLKEIHHRVKNNLQLISSFLALEAMKPENERSAAPLLQAQRRVRSLSLIHESLYASELFDKVNFAEYAERLVRETVTNGPEPSIQVRSELAHLTLSIEKAIPCALLLNEALTNIAKYAFPSTWTGERSVLVRLEEDDPGRIRLTIVDSGVGLPSDYDPERTETLGHTIMKLLARQLGGELVIRSDCGTEVVLRFAA
ncbi:sensor histidine kinase [Salinispira pacifica]